MNKHHRPPVNGLTPRDMREAGASPYDWWQAYPAPVPRRDWWLGVALAVGLGLAGVALLLWELDALVVSK